MRRLRYFPFSPNCIFTEKTVDTYVTIFYLPRRGDLFPRKFHSILPKFDFTLPNYHSVLPWRFLLFSVSIFDFLHEECDAVLFIIPCLCLLYTSTPLLQDIMTNGSSSSTSLTGEFNHSWHSRDGKYNWLNSLFYMKKKAHATDALRYSTDGNPIKEEQNINDASNQQFYAATQLSTQLTPIWALESGASYTMTKSNTNYSSVSYTHLPNRNPL